MTIRSKILTLLLLLVSVSVYAQEGLSSIGTYLDKLRRDDYFTMNNKLKYSDVEGSPYLIDAFREGVLLMKSGQALTGNFRYDLYANQLEFSRDENVFVIAKPDSIARIGIDDFVLVYRDYTDKSEIKKSFFLLIEEGFYSAYQQKVVIFRNASEPRPYQDAPLPARFEEGADQFYMSAGDSPAVKISSANDIVSVCGDKGQAARDFIRKEKINVRRPADLARLIRHLNGV